MNTLSRAPIPPIPRKYPEYDRPERGAPWGVILLVLLLLAALGAAGYFYWQTLEVKKAAPAVVAKAETADLLEEIGKILVLPTDEQPTVATVNDIEKLKDQPFFAKAKIGDKVIIYSKNQKVILYDPLVKKIVEVGAINLENPIE